MEEFSNQLEKQSLIDLTNRSQSGVGIYLAVWLAVTLPSQMYKHSPVFFSINVAIMLIMVIIRAWHLVMFMRGSYKSNIKMYRWLEGCILVSGMHWGVMVAIVLSDWDSSSSMPYLWIVVTMSVAIGGAAVFSISNAIRIFYPFLMIIPGGFILLIHGGTEQWIFVILGIVALFYINRATKVANTDYWVGIKNRFLAEKRATEMERLSHTDQLTQLNNRMFFDQKFAEEWKRSSRLGTPLSILMIDLDYFKVINDSYGHVFGDECLKRVAESLLEIIHRETDSVARYGGEEFVVLLPDTDKQESEAIATRLLAAVAKSGMFVGDHAVPLTCSIGVATGYAGPTINREVLLKSADDALYLAKNKGRNRVQIGSMIDASMTDDSPTNVSTMNAS